MKHIKDPELYIPVWKLHAVQMFYILAFLFFKTKITESKTKNQIHEIRCTYLMKYVVMTDQRKINLRSDLVTFKPFE